MVTREPFAGLSHAEVVVWYGFIVISTAVFVWGAAQLVAKYRRGRAEALDHPGERLARMVRTTFSHARLARRDRTAGVGHALIFFGFLLLFGGTTVLGIQTDLATPLLHWQFWQGGFYLGYQLCLDVAGLALLAGLCVMAAKRWIARPARLDYGRVDGAPGDERRTRYRVGDQIFVASLFFLAVTGFLLEGFWLAQTHPSYGGWSPVGWVLAAWFRAMGLTGAAAGLAHHVLWWVHGLVALAFVACIPYTKAVHMLAAPATVAVRDPRAGRHLVPVAPDADPEDVGYGRITDLSWRHLLSLDACTKCGKCHEACPARASGYPLSPRDLILDLREAAEAATGIHASVKLGPRGEPDALLVGQALRPETLWSCMQCMACVEICPVEIEHVPIINQLRRRLVEEGELDPLLQSTLETIHKSGNSFGEAKRKRGRWTGQLDFPVKDIRREPAQLLWFVGDYASFDPRNQQASRALATVLHHAGVDFGILFDAERTGGCDVRRVGEEGLFAELAEHNVETIAACEFERIFSSDAHTFNTLANEYPEYGGHWTVLHHSQLLLELLEAGTLVPARRLGYRVTYHDPCNLGRYNGVYDAPRRVLEAIGVEVVEMPRSRDNSFCCGAGGGRIWMKELAAPGSRRPSEDRIDEATSLGDLDYFVVACPKDVTMFEDAIKTSGHGQELQLRELSELVLESLALPRATTSTEARTSAPA